MGRRRWLTRELLCGALFGLALLIKLDIVILLPLAVFVAWWRQCGGDTQVAQVVGCETPCAPRSGGESRNDGQGAPSSAFHANYQGPGRTCGAGASYAGGARSPVRVAGVQRTGRPTPLRHLCINLLAIGFGAGITFVAVYFLIEGGAFLRHFQQTWASHFGAAKSFEYGSASEHPFDWSVLLRNWDTTVPALLGICLCLWPRRAGKGTNASGSSPVSAISSQDQFRFLPAAWFGLMLAVFALHRPWWSYYYVHLAVPLCWCAAIGVTETWRFLACRSRIVLARTCPKIPSSQSLSKTPSHTLSKRGPNPAKFSTKFSTKCSRGSLRPVLAVACLFGLCAMGWMGARLYLQIAGIRRSPQTYATLALQTVERLKPFAHFIYADDPIYSFHTGIPMPPDLAVVPLKRLWAGELTNAKIAAEMRQIKPEVLLRRNDTRQVPFQALMDSGYRMIYQDPDGRLYTLRSVARQAGF